MKLFLREITEDPKEHSFHLSAAQLNERANAVCVQVNGPAVRPPEYQFPENPAAEVSLYMRRDTVFFSGTWRARVTSSCARCASDVTLSLNGTVRLVLKPISESGDPDLAFDDIDFGYYRHDYIDCADLIEEDVMRQLPYAVHCEDAGEASCDTSVTGYMAEDAEQEIPAAGDERMAIFRQLKVE